CREVQEKVQYRIIAKLTGNSHFQFFLGSIHAIIIPTYFKFTLRIGMKTTFEALAVLPPGFDVFEKVTE
ncbi:MAG: hypothetical protein K0Q48_2678, partial [Bacillota bacterium]|nr:hypothetical protein [Bacillota bacterium]